MKIKKYLPHLLAFVLVSLPVVASAQTVNQGLTTSGLQGLFGFGGSSSLTGSQSLSQLITNIIRILLLIVGSIAVLFIIYGGYMYVTSAGNEEQAEKGRNTLVNALIGIVVVTMAYVLVTIIANLVVFNRV
jgi:formate hydrogenlyase subunit 3/multisubunit Na+/H+ antiporter MnhD subunit